MAGRGLDSAVLARGPHHHWGPMADRWGDPLRAPAAMQLPAEYEWIAPGGDGLLLHHLPAHYSAGWPSDRAPDAEAAAEQLLALYELLRTCAATRNVLIPMGTDFSWPHRWGLDVQHAWNRRYCWPRMEHSGPRAHFDAVRAEFAARGERPLPVTREMGPGPVPAGLWVRAPEPAVTVAPGERGRVRALIGANGVRTALRGRTHAVSPYGTWGLIGPAARPLHVPADGVAEVEFELRPPLDTPPGEYWMLVKAVCQGRIAYGPAIAPAFRPA